MTEQSDNKTDELSLLKERAKILGVQFSGNIKLETLKARVEAKLSGEPEVEEEDEENVVEDEVSEIASKRKVAPVRKLTKAEQEQALRDKLVRESMRLVRVRIYNLNPAKRDLPGEIIAVGNRYIGTVKKFIPFGEATENGYHIPQVLLDDLKSRKFNQIRTKSVNGQVQVESRMVPEYQIEVMPMLSKEQLEELALKQAAAERVGL